MKTKRIFIGIDVSKLTLDVFIYNTSYHFKISNGPDGFAILLETILTMFNGRKEDLLICFENTGKYSRMLSVFLQTQGITFVMEPALKIKKSLGLTRGRNDKVDSKRIALYAYEKRETLVPTILPGEKIDRLKSLLSLREKLIKHRTSYKNGITDVNDCYTDGENAMIIEMQQRLISNLDLEIERIEQEIDKIITSEPSMSTNFNLVISVKGIGKINAYFLIAYTANFTLFKDARALACYCGIAPFESSSGIFNGKPRVNHLANKKIKTMLNMAAVAAIRAKGEHKEYYNRRVKNGKSKMSTLNIIRNKLLYRVFAVVNRGTPYVDLYKFAA